MYTKLKATMNETAMIMSVVCTWRRAIVRVTALYRNLFRRFGYRYNMYETIEPEISIEALEKWYPEYLRSSGFLQISKELSWALAGQRSETE